THEKELSLPILTFIINLHDDVVKKGAFQYSDIEQLVKDHDCDYLLGDDVIKILRNHSQNQVKVCLFMLGPQGTPCLSAFSFEKKDIMKNQPILLGDGPTKATENPCFSKNVLIETFKQFTKEPVPSLISFLDDEKSDLLRIL